MLNIPVLAISHHPKVAALMNDLGLSDYCVDIRALDINLLTTTFSRLVDNGDEVKARMTKKVVCYQGELTAQFNRLFPQETAVGPVGRL